MATQDTKEPGTQPAAQDAPGAQSHGSRKSTEEEAEHPNAGGLDDIPDGDGPRSDRGNNPLPETYWADYPGGKP